MAEICDNRFISLNASDDKKTAVEVFRKYDRSVLPVVDTHGQLVGIVTLDDVIDIAEEAASARSRGSAASKLSTSPT